MSDDHITEFVKHQGRDWLAGVQAADRLMLHMSKSTSHPLRAGASIFLTAMALQRMEGFYFGLESAQGGLGAALNEGPEDILGKFGEFVALAKTDIPNMYNTMLRGLLMRDIASSPKLSETLAAFEAAFALLISPEVVHELLSTVPTEQVATSGEVTITMNGGTVTIRRGALILSPELWNAYATGASHDEVQRLAKSLAESTGQDVELLDTDGNVKETVTQ